MTVSVQQKIPQQTTASEKAPQRKSVPKKSSPKKSLIRAENLCVTFGTGDTRFNAVDNLSVDIYQGEFTFIFGASGCGKTTLLNVLGGMASPTSGRVFFDGNDISHMTNREKVTYRRNSVGFIFQHYNLIAGLTAAENVAVSAALTPGSLNPCESLAMVGLEEKANSYPKELSGGQQQRVCIARAICKNAPLILADEPTGALDVQSASKVLEILTSLVREHGTTVVMVTHNPDLAPMADRIITMSDGAIIKDERTNF